MSAATVKYSWVDICLYLSDYWWLASRPGQNAVEMFFMIWVEVIPSEDQNWNIWKQKCSDYEK